MAAKKSSRKSARKSTKKAAKKSARKSARKSTARKTGGARKTAAKKSTGRKSAAKKGGAKKSGARKFGKKASKKIGRVMHEFAEGKLKSGKGGAGGKVKSREQAIAIGISEARAEGDKVPKKRTAAKKRGRKSASSSS